MPKHIRKFLIFMLVVILLTFILIKYLNLSQYTNKNEISNTNTLDLSVSNNGWLSIDNTNLINEKKQEIQLTGLSSHGIQWYSDIITKKNLEYLKKDFNINIFRVAMYSEYYVQDPENLKQKLTNIVDMVIDLDMYVIIDWHILEDSNPNTYYTQSNDFFNEMSLKYKDTPNVIYEICNEPNGNAVRWEEDIKPYAEKIIPTIRNNSPKSLIIVGTPDWCKNLKVVADNPLNFNNITYACHFYSGTHGEELQTNIDYALSKNISIFVSECGLTDASGDGNLYLNEFNNWINFLNERKISWIVWSFSNKNESSAIVLPNYTISSNLENTDNNLNINDYLSESGIYLKQLLNTKQ